MIATGRSGGDEMPIALVRCIPQDEVAGRAREASLERYRSSLAISLGRRISSGRNRRCRARARRGALLMRSGRSARVRLGRNAACCARFRNRRYERPLFDSADATAGTQARACLRESSGAGFRAQWLRLMTFPNYMTRGDDNQDRSLPRAKFSLRAYEDPMARTSSRTGDPQHGSSLSLGNAWFGIPRRPTSTAEWPAFAPRSRPVAAAATYHGITAVSFA